MLDVASFSFQPSRLWRFIGVSATINDPGHVIAEFFPDIAQSFRAATIFRRIVKKRSDGFRFIRAVLQRDRSDAKNMRDVRNPRFLAHLIPMRAGRINQRFLKLLRKLHLNQTSAVATALCGVHCASSENLNVPQERGYSHLSSARNLHVLTDAANL